MIETGEKYYLNWEEDPGIDNLLDRAITQLCRKERLLETIHDFMIFDAGTKKTCRHNHYFGKTPALHSLFAARLQIPHLLPMRRARSTAS